jgi:hypothetical protein
MSSNPSAMKTKHNKKPKRLVWLELYPDQDLGIYLQWLINNQD